MPLHPLDGKVRLQILADRTSLEIFGNDGVGYMPMPSIPKEEDKSLAVFARGGAAKFPSLYVVELRSAWKRALRPWRWKALRKPSLAFRPSGRADLSCAPERVTP